MTCSRKIIDTIKIIGKIENVAARNGVNYTDGYLELGGPLIRDTIVNGNYNLSFGSVGSNVNYFSVSSNTTVYLEASNGIQGSFINIANDSVLLGSSAPNTTGLQGAHDYSANYDALTYIQRIYADTKIAGKSLAPEVIDPQPEHEGHRIVWDSTNNQWTLSAPGSAPSAGEHLQVIFNEDGILTGSDNFTYSRLADIFTVTRIHLGHAGLGGTYRIIVAESNTPDLSIIMATKGTGYFNIATWQGKVVIGASDSPNTAHSITAMGFAGKIDIAIEPKGTEGVVLIGDKDEVGAYRYLRSRSYASDAHFRIQAQGAGDIILEPSSDFQTDLSYQGTVRIGFGNPGDIVGSTARYLIAQSSFVTTSLVVAGSGVGSYVFIGGNEAASTRYMAPNSSSPDCNLNIVGKGLGLVAVNNIIRSKKVAIPVWNMDNTGGVSVAHGLGINDWKKIVSVEVIIRNNFDSDYGPLDRLNASTIDPSPIGKNTPAGGVTYWDNAAIYLKRVDGGYYDNANFNSIAAPRGWVYISYEL